MDELKQYPPHLLKKCVCVCVHVKGESIFYMGELNQFLSLIIKGSGGKVLKAEVQLGGDGGGDKAGTEPWTSAGFELMRKQTGGA